MILGFILFAIFVCVWYVPPYVRQGKIGRVPGKYYLLAIGAGLIPATILLLLGEAGVTQLMHAAKLTGTAYHAVDAWGCAALVEEAVKFLFAWLIVRAAKPTRKLDYALLFGAVGMGYEIFESSLAMDGAIAACFRGVLVLHIMWQIWMGLFYYEYQQAKLRNDKPAARKNLIISLVVPWFIHGLNDFIALMGESSMTAAEVTPEAAKWIIILLIFLLLCLVYVIFTMRMVYKQVRITREYDAQVAAEQDYSCEGTASPNASELAAEAQRQLEVTVEER